MPKIEHNDIEFMDRQKASSVQEDFLKATYLFASEGKEATNSEIAGAMDVSPAAASAMAKRLGEQGLLIYHKYREIELTSQGRMIALEMLRHHRLLELFLTETLKIPWELVHQIAEKFEHDLDEGLEDAIDSFLEGPSTDPHGDPIPSKEGFMPSASTQLLVDLPDRTTRIVTRVLTQKKEMLAYLGSINLRPKTQVTILERKPLNGPQRLKLNDSEDLISHEVASLIVVSEEDDL